MSDIGHNRSTYTELVKLRDMTLTWHRFMEEPRGEDRAKWDTKTASYIEELEQILQDLNAQAIEALWQEENGGRR